VFVNRMPRYEILSEESMAVLEEGWQSIVRDIGIEFQHEPALELFRKAGQKVEGDLVKLDPEWVLEQVAKAPREFPFIARNPARSRHFGGQNMVFVSVQSAPFVSEGSRRGDGTFDDYRRLVRLTHMIDELDTPGYPICEAGDLPIDSRHLQMLLCLYTDTDKPLGTAQFNPVGAGDSIAMAELAFGRDALERAPHMFGIANANSPLRFDERMIGSLMLLAAANQIVVVTPFILMGAMGPVSIPAALSQQIAEQLAGICLAQLVRPGAPVIMGSFISHTDMQSGSPGFGGPEAAIGLFASGQIARRFGLPWRAGGGSLTSSQSVDAQAAFEGLNTMLPAFLAGANLLLHTCGWLESGLVASYEKFVLDIEIVRILQAEFSPLEFKREHLVPDAFAEAGHGGHFFGTTHTLENFRDCFYRPLLFSTENYDRWTSRGGKDAAERARDKLAVLEASYEPPPPLDDDAHGRLTEYVVRRQKELGD
jgi:trimethylamine---corrinoid protein Co-methyltransferase